MADLLAEGIALHVVKVLLQPLHVRCSRAKGIDDYPAFLRDIRDRIAERNDGVSTLERASRLLSDDPVLGRNVFPQLPKLVEALDIAERRVAEDRAAVDRKRKSEARLLTTQAVDPAVAARTEALHERLRLRLGCEVFAGWFSDLACERFERAQLTASVSSKFLKRWIDQTYCEELHQLAAAEFPGLGKVEIVVRGENATRAA